ncbi:hypothetical protein D9611_004972 [Ephemerocybe angulata]|uniref:F-box domain-containing protein n=1 Tax=Ephemerocybe angulata TaxID=980116 RepID=A0A8H5B356_9AGAR|nr:hypothetical protein D9611_004972 [Tulosesus angulatus]
MKKTGAIAPRRNPRRTNTALQVTSPLATANASTSIDAEPIKPPKKRQKVESASTDVTFKKPGKARNKKGCLKIVVDLPVDMLLEVFSYLDPVDLYNLARTDRSLRALLLSRSAAQAIWTNAFERINYTCPDDLTPPRFASMLFGGCFHCPSKQGQCIWAYYDRVCTRCSRERYTDIIGKDDLSVVLRKIIPSCKVIGSKQRPSLMYLKEEVESQREALGKLVQGTKTYLAYVKKAEKQAATIMKWACAHVARDEERRNLDQNKAYLLKVEREKEIMARLTDLGYERELREIWKWRSLSGVSIASRLTESNWEKIKPRLLECLEAPRRAAALQKWKELIIERTRTLSVIYEDYLAQNQYDGSTAPTAGELATMEPFRSIIYDSPEQDTVTASELSKHTDTLPNLISVWNKGVVDHLLSLLPQGQAIPGGGTVISESDRARKEPPPSLRSVSELYKATSTFNCITCSSTLLFPNVLVHKCLLRPDVKNADDPNGLWNQGRDQVLFDTAGRSVVNLILSLIDMDSNTATWKEVDTAGHRLSCMRCRYTRSYNACAMSWRYAVVHESTAHSCDQASIGEGAWEVLDPIALEAAGYRSERPSEIEVDERVSNWLIEQWARSTAGYLMTSDQNRGFIEDEPQPVNLLISR